MALEIVTNKSTRDFEKVVAKALGAFSGKVCLVMGKESAGKEIFSDLKMQITKEEDTYYLAVLENKYDRVEYEKFLRLAKDRGIELGSNLWLLMQLTFPMEFWSMTKQQSIQKKIALQQFQVLGHILARHLQETIKK